ncbi:uncharacterized protein LOC115219138, partial [Argonauta hians]
SKVHTMDNQCTEPQRIRNYQNKIIKCKAYFLKWDLSQLDEFSQDMSVLPLEDYHNFLKITADECELKDKLKKVIDFLVTFLDEKHVKCVTDVLETYFPDNLIGYNENLTPLLQKAKQIQAGMSFVILEAMLKYLKDDYWKVLARHLGCQSEITTDSLEEKCKVFINLVPKPILLKDLCYRFLFALSEHCECELSIAYSKNDLQIQHDNVKPTREDFEKFESLDEILEVALKEQNAEYFLD